MLRELNDIEMEAVSGGTDESEVVVEGEIQFTPDSTIDLSLLAL